MQLHDFLSTDSGGIILARTEILKKWYDIVFIRKHRDGGIIVFILELAVMTLFKNAVWIVICFILLLISMHALEVLNRIIASNKEIVMGSLWKFESLTIGPDFRLQ
ncbi:hypothetical protein F8M41_011780 [Gigaspora margarita]|uniref:Uncharacterized protein n=1 Tax=Gigaspora margarita TaxID=4874 RepID=A0A8H4EPP0_GIGMA|nr:hypothetical protein F8M41_011780 [Gigaspora margarita]